VQQPRRYRLDAAAAEPRTESRLTIASRMPTRTPYHGWVLVGVLGITEIISWGVLYYAFSVFVTPMEADLGWSRGETTGAFPWHWCSQAWALYRLAAGWTAMAHAY